MLSSYFLAFFLLVLLRMVADAGRQYLPRGFAMTTTEAEKLLKKGVAALANGHTHLAMTCLEQAMHYARTPKTCSYLAYCIALNSKRFDDAIALGREALEAEPNSSLYCLNLGRILLLAGRKEEAITVFRQGLVFSRDAALIYQLEELGTRKPPIFTAMPREHFANRLCGILGSKIGLR